MLKLKGSKAKRAKSLAEGLNLKVPHLALHSELGNEIVVPIHEDNQVIILQALVGLRKTWYHSNSV